MSYDLTGKVKLIQDAQTFGSGFTKREIVVTVEDVKYPQDINLEFLKDDVSMLDDFVVGQEVTISFNLRGREYNGRYFNNLVGWKINAAASGGQSTSKPAPVADEPVADDEDDIPF
jgi:hypothetical protein